MSIRREIMLGMCRGNKIRSYLKTVHICMQPRWTRVWYHSYTCFWRQCYSLL